MDELEAIKNKILSIDELPTYDEVLRFKEEEYSINNPNKQFLGVWQVYNKEFVDELTKEIKNLDVSPIIEVCAGSGKLSYWLRKNGINIVATDDYSDERIYKDKDLVENLPHTKALEKHQPRLVIASFIPYSSKVAMDVLDHPSVEYYIDIGEKIVDDRLPRTGDPGIWLRKDVEKIDLENVNKYSIGTSQISHDHGKTYVHFMKNSYVTLFTKI